MPQNNLQLTPVHNPDAEAALTAALNIRAAGGVPLIIDPRAPVSTCALEAALPDNAAWAVLTSGTTGAPKIVVRSQDSWQVAFSPLNTQLGLQPGDGIWLPVHQVSSMALFTAAWAQASGLNLIVGPSGLDRASVAHVTPAWLEQLLDQVDAGQASTVHTVLVGGDRLAADLRSRACQLGLRIITYVGAAELSFVAWDLGEGLQAFDGVRTRLADGVLWVASEQLALEVIGGRLQQRFIGDTRWVSVGDRATENNGILQFHGRTDAAILTAGATVIPSEIEDVINQHPEVNASLVLGRPDAMLGQRVVAWVESQVETHRLVQWVRSRLPKAARPVQWHRVTALPRTPSGKIRRIDPEEA